MLGQVGDVMNKTSALHSKTAKNIAAVSRSGKGKVVLFILRPSLELGTLQTSLHSILHEDFTFKA